jgi:hypothetical protein
VMTFISHKDGSDQDQIHPQVWSMLLTTLDLIVSLLSLCPGFPMTKTCAPTDQCPGVWIHTYCQKLLRVCQISSIFGQILVGISLLDKVIKSGSIQPSLSNEDRVFHTFSLEMRKR